MPAQSLRRWTDAERRPLKAPGLWRTPWFSRLVAFGGMAVITAAGGWQMYKVVEAGGVTLLEWAFLVFFVVNFSWIALAFTTGLLGLADLLVHGLNRKPDLPPALKERTAVVMPIYNESPARVFGTVQAIAEDVLATGHGASFDFFFLSDTTDPDIWIAEERSYVALRERLPDIAIHYRHRPKNTARKAGNIADFVTPMGRQLRPYDRARRRQPDDRRDDRGPGRRHGEGPGRRHHPDPAAAHQPQHAHRPPAAVRGAGLRPRLRRGPRRLVGPRQQLLGPQRHHPHGGLRLLGRPAGPAGQAALRRPHPQPRLRRGGLIRRRGYAVYMLDDGSTAPTRRARPR
jgi:hypothetical protein